MDYRGLQRPPALPRRWQLQSRQEHFDILGVVFSMNRSQPFGLRPSRHADLAIQRDRARPSSIGHRTVIEIADEDRDLGVGQNAFELFGVAPRGHDDRIAARPHDQG